MTRQALLIVGFLVAAYPLQPSVAQQQKVGDPPEASNMRLVGWNDLQARSAYQPTIHRQGDRWIAYIGHHGGTDDDPDAAQPDDRQGRVQRHLDRRRHRSAPTRNTSRTCPGQPGKDEEGGAQMVRVCDGARLPKGDRVRRLHAAHLRRRGARDLERRRSRPSRCC